ncbi:batten's disease protein Cln3 [Colletotrichum cereale]|nr:batten's disease protein Cln3 [Colletotrichum cereale]
MSFSQLNGPPIDKYRVRIFLGFALIGLANAILVRVSHAANYLIIPYPQAAVLLLELLPPALTKLFLPFVFAYIPRNVRPVLLAGLWLLVKVVVSATPPNVLPPVRVLMTLLAACTSAATELCCLDLIRRYGRLGLVAWAIGTSLGQMANATWPLVLTSSMRMTLREGTGYMYQLVATILFAYFFVLPRSNLPTGIGEVGLDNRDSASYYETSMMDATLTTQDKGSRKSTRNSGMLSAVTIKYLPTLLLASAAQAMVFPGAALALDGSSFSSLLSWTSALAFALHLGNFTARLSAVSLRLGNHRVVLILLAWMVALLLADSIFFLGASWVVLSVAFGSGLLGGAVYIEVFDGVFKAVSGHSDCVLSLGVISAVDTIGSLLGGLVALLWEAAICNMTVDPGRFCHRSRWN